MNTTIFYLDPTKKFVPTMPQESFLSKMIELPVYTLPVLRVERLSPPKFSEDTLHPNHDYVKIIGAGSGIEFDNRTIDSIVLYLQCQLSTKYDQTTGAKQGSLLASTLITDGDEYGIDSFMRIVYELLKRNQQMKWFHVQVKDHLSDWRYSPTFATIEADVRDRITFYVCPQSAKLNENSQGLQTLRLCKQFVCIGVESPANEVVRYLKNPTAFFRTGRMTFDPADLMTFPANVFLDLLDMQFQKNGIYKNEESKQVNDLLKHHSIEYKSFDPLRQIEEADQTGDQPSGLCNRMITEFRNYKLPNPNPKPDPKSQPQVKYSLVRELLKTIISEKGVDFVGPNLTDPLDRTTPLDNNPAAIRRKADQIERYMDDRIKDIVTSTMVTSTMVTRPWLLVTAGVPGVGKSYVMQRAHDYLKGFEGLREKRYFNCDPDRIYDVLRYCEQFDDVPPTRHMVNYWNHVSFGIALSRKSNIVFDGSGRECLNICGRAIARAIDEGYQIGFLFVTLPMSTIIKQIYERDQELSCNVKGRQTSLAFVQTVAKALARRVPDYIDYFGTERSAVVSNERGDIKRVGVGEAVEHLREFVETPLTNIEAIYNEEAKKYESGEI